VIAGDCLSQSAKPRLPGQRGREGAAAPGEPRTNPGQGNLR